VLPQFSLPARHTLTFAFNPTSLSIKQLLLGDQAASPGCARTEMGAGRAQRASRGLRWSRLCSVPQFPLGSFADDAELSHLLWNKSSWSRFTLLAAKDRAVKVQSGAGAGPAHEMFYWVLSQPPQGLGPRL